MRRATTALALLLLILVAHACGDGGSTGLTETGPHALEAVGTLPTEPVVGSAIPVRVRVTDEGGGGIQGITVGWSVLAGDGSLSTSSTVTDASGEAVVEWTLGTEAGENRLGASVEGVTALTLATTAVAGSVASIEVSPPSRTLTALGDTAHFSASAFDGFGNPVSGSSAAWSSTNTAIVSIDATGVATAHAEGTANVIATVETFTDTAAVTVEQQAATVTLTPSDIALTAAGDTVRLTAVATDANGNVLSGGSVQWSNTNTSVVSLTTDGLIEARAEGTASVIATVGAAADTVSVPVYTSSGVSRTWTGEAGTAWADPLNWLPAGQPNVQDTTSVPGATSRMPALTANGQAGPLTVESGATVDLAGYMLTLYGDVAATGPVTGSGTMALAGSDAMLFGTVPALLFTGTVSLSGATSAGSVTITGGTLTLPGQTLTIRP